MDLFRGGEWVRAAPIFWEHDGNCAVRQGDWKLVREAGRDWELYDMTVDRTELIDLGGRDPGLVGRLSQEHAAWAEAVGVRDWPQLRLEVARAWGSEAV